MQTTHTNLDPFLFVEPLLPHITDPHILSFRAGEETGFTYFFRSYHTALCFFALRYVKQQVVAEDLVEESFVNVWAKRSQMESEAGLRAYLYKTVYHACLRWRQAEAKRLQHQAAYAQWRGEVEPDFTNSIIKTESIRLLRKAMDQLPVQCRTVFHKLYVEGKSVSETAVEMKLSISTIKNQKARGIKLLRIKMAGLAGVLIFLLSRIVEGLTTIKP